MSWQVMTGLVVAGALGTLARFGLQGLLQTKASWFPWGTLAVNLLGCVLFGLVFGYAEKRVSVTPEIRTTILVGFMGAFTTFSTLVAETGFMLEKEQWGRAFANLALHNVLGLVLFFLALRLAARL